MSKDFILTKQQDIAVLHWNISHVESEECQEVGRSSIGGRLTYSFTPTGLGCVVVVRCACGAEIDLTDYTDW
jgi:hypothetical protein